MDVHLLSPGWSPIIQNVVTNLPKDGNPFSKGLSTTIPMKVKHRAQDGHSPTVEWSWSLSSTKLEFDTKEPILVLFNFGIL